MRSIQSKFQLVPRSLMLLALGALMSGVSQPPPPPPGGGSGGVQPNFKNKTTTGASDPSPAPLPAVTVEVLQEVRPSDV